MSSVMASAYGAAQALCRDRGATDRWSSGLFTHIAHFVHEGCKTPATGLDMLSNRRHAGIG